MNFKQSISIDSAIDLVLPFRKDKLNHDQIIELTNISKPDFNGEFSEIQMLYGKNGQRIYLLGLGTEKQASQMSEAFRSLFFNNRKKLE